MKNLIVSKVCILKKNDRENLFCIADFLGFQLFYNQLIKHSIYYITHYFTKCFKISMSFSSFFPFKNPRSKIDTNCENLHK